MPKQRTVKPASRYAITFFAILTLLSFYHFGSLKAKEHGSDELKKLLPPISAIVSAGFECSKTLPADIFDTARRCLSSLGLALTFGIPAGLFIGSKRWFYDGISPVLDFFRSIPVTTLYPIFAMIAGFGFLSKIAMGFFACFFVITLSCAYGARFSPPRRKTCLRLMGANSWNTFVFSTLPEALPSVLSGTRVAASLALVVTILVEMFMGADNGLGVSIMDGYQTLHLDIVYFYIFVCGTLGLGLNRLLAFLERWIAPWAIANADHF